MKIYANSHAQPQARYQRCSQCDTLFFLPDIKPTQSAHCPHCNACIRNGRGWSMTRLYAMAFTMLLLIPFAFTEPLLSISLLGSNISASLLDGVLQMSVQGHVITATMVAFCTIGASVTLTGAIFCLWIGHRLGMNLRPVLLILPGLKEWVILDICLAGIAVAAIKVQDYASLEAGSGLIAFSALALLSLMMLIHINEEELWCRYYPQPVPAVPGHNLRLCLACHFTAAPDRQGCCPRCHTPLPLRYKHSLQKSWAALTAAMVLLIPANVLPVSVIYLNGTRKEDTIFSGIMSLATDNIPVAAVVFIASILVPFMKVLVLLALLISIHFRCGQGLKTRIRLLRIVTWVGRWSMLDLFVLSLTMSLVNRDQLLAFTMGPAAFYFGAAVILTILAVEWLDSRLLWDAHATGNAAYTD